MAEEKGLSIGIDLGTTNSSICHYDTTKKHAVVVVENQDDGLYPSYISLVQYKENKTVLVGNVARNDIYSEYALFDAKRIIGKDMQQISKLERDNWPFEVKQKRELVEVKTLVQEDGITKEKMEKKYLNTVFMETLNPKTRKREMFFPEEVSGTVLKYLRSMLEKTIVHMKPKNVVITVPTNFNDQQRNATKMAAKLAGLEVSRLVNEPIAAIVAYRHEFPNSLQKDDIVLVIDFGGGTLDVNMCKIEGNEIRAFCTKGDQNLGGNNFDLIIMEMIKDELEKEGIVSRKYFEKDENEIDMLDSDSEGDDQPKKKYEFDHEGSLIDKLKRIQRLRTEAERIKKEFGNNKTTGKYPEEVSVDLSKVLQDIFGDDYDEEYDDKIIIDYGEFSDLCKKGLKDQYGKVINQTKLIERFNKVIGECINESGVDMDDITKVLCVGGSCALRLIREIVERKFKDKMAEPGFNPMTAVCKGAGIIANTIEKGIEKEVYRDTIPYDIGFEGVHGHEFIKIARERDHLPIIGKEYIVHPGRDYLDEVCIKLFAGNQPRTDILSYGIDACLSHEYMEQLDQINVRVPKLPKNQVEIKCKLNITTSGMLDLFIYVNGEEYNIHRKLNIANIDNRYFKINLHFKEFAPNVEKTK